MTSPHAAASGAASSPSVVTALLPPCSGAASSPQSRPLRRRVVSSIATAPAPRRHLNRDRPARHLVILGRDGPRALADVIGHPRVVADFTAALRAPPGAPLTTFSVFRYPRGQRWWAFKNQGSARRPLAAVEGLMFFRLLGSGSGFSVRPDFSRYALLATWSSEQAADAFFAAHPVSLACHARAAEAWTVKLLPRRVRGAWLGRDPFLGAADPPVLPDTLPVVVLTRAALRLRALPSFWSRAPAINRHLLTAPGLRVALGVGELPWLRPVTFSVWDATAPMEQFAHHAGAHHDAARTARVRGWFKEDLFARFAAIASHGLLDGRDPCGFHP